MPDIKVVKSIYRAVKLLQCLADGFERITDIAERVELNKSTVYRILKTLEASGFVMQDPVTEHYYLGHLIIRLASNPTISHQGIIVSAFDEMKHLWEISGESVALSVKAGAERLVIEELTSIQNIRYTLGKGFVSPLHIGGSGKVILSQLPEEDRDYHLRVIKLVNPRTGKVINKEALVNELNKIKKQGYAMTADETIEGSAGITAPIGGYVCPTTLSIFGPKERFEPIMVDFLEELKESVNRISRKFPQK